MRVYLGPSYQHFRVDSIENLGRFVNEPDNGLNHSTLDRPRSYLGGDLRVEINSKNNDMLPTRGIQLDAGIRPLFGINGTSHNVTMVNLDMRIFMSLATQKRLVLATRFGWGKNYGDYLFPQAQYLSGTDNLRGYRKQRFAGRAMLFNNTEIRIKISDFNTYLFPGSIGLQVFNDIGRVFADGEKSNIWHDGYGLGIWVAPINRFVITASLARSEEEKALPRVTFGFEF
jgi:outer membrane protein assembly factor BamA